MKRVEASSRSTHQTGLFRIESPEILPQPGRRGTPGSAYGNNWVEEIWPDCLVDRTKSNPAALEDLLGPRAGSPY